MTEIFLFHYVNSFMGMFFFVKSAEAQKTCKHQCQSDQRQKSWSLWLLRLETVPSQSLCSNISFLSGRICLVELFTRRNQVPPDFFPAFAPMINWVMVHVANSPSRPRRDGSDCADRPITESCETEPAPNDSLFPHPATITSSSNRCSAVGRGWQGRGNKARQK